MSEKIIEISNLCKAYGSFLAVNNLNLEVYAGDVYGFLGPNGAGKSTTIRMMVSLIRPDSGRISIFRKSLMSNREAILGKIGCIVEKPDFYKYLSAEKNLEIFAKLSGVRVEKSKLEEIFELVGLSGRQKDAVKNYSHGMKQRLGLAQTLVHNPDLIILDEPTTGLDPQGIIDIRNLINHLSKDLKKTIVLSSHILSEIELIATRMVIINKGKAIVEGNVNELLNASELVVSFSVNDMNKADGLISNSGWKNKLKETNQHQMIFNLERHETGLLNKFLCDAGIEISGIESKKKLEDYFLQLLNKN